uniref:Uncharacterized protein n=1 Tax=Anguilla anguilla TaxID=7936 RepID=A0A0E9UYK2_ANGAN
MLFLSLLCIQTKNNTEAGYCRSDPGYVANQL